MPYTVIAVMPVRCSSAIAATIDAQRVLPAACAPASPSRSLPVALSGCYVQSVPEPAPRLPYGKPAASLPVLQRLDARVLVERLATIRLSEL